MHIPIYSLSMLAELVSADVSVKNPGIQNLHLIATFGDCRGRAVQGSRGGRPAEQLVI